MCSGICAVSFLSGNAKITPRLVGIISLNKYGQAFHNNDSPNLSQFSVAKERGKDWECRMKSMIEARSSRRVPQLRQSREIGIETNSLVDAGHS